MSPRRGRRPLLGSAAFLLVGCAVSASSWTTPTTSNRFFVAGYHPYWAGDDWQRYPGPTLDELYFFELEAAGDGSFLDRHGWPTEWTVMVESMRSEGVQVTPTVSMHDPVAFTTLFADDAAIDRLVGNVVGLLAETPGLAGIHLDFEVFEPVAPEVSEGFTTFARRLAASMEAHDPSASLSIFTLAFDDDDVYDERGLADAADYLVIQGYDFHSMGSDSAGPVAAAEGWGRLNWGHVIDRFLALGVPPRKLVMSVPMYGYEWPVESDEPGAPTRDTGVTVPYAPSDDVLPELPRVVDRVSAHGVRRDEISSSPYYAYRTDEGWRQGWFDDAVSLRRKYQLVRDRGLGGVAVFPAAYADAALWEELRRSFSGPRPLPAGR